MQHQYQPQYQPQYQVVPYRAPPTPSPYGALDKSALGGMGVVGALGLILVLPTFVVGPWAVKQFQPEWSYGKRLVTSVLVGSGIGIVRMLVGGKRT